MKLFFKILHTIFGMLVILSWITIIGSLSYMIWAEPNDLLPLRLFGTAIITAIISRVGMGVIEDNYMYF